MAKVLVKGPTDTPFAGSTALTLPIPGLNWTTDFRRQPVGPTGEVIAVNVTAPTDQPETVRFSQRAVPNVYAGQAIDAASQLPSKTGTATLIELKQNWVQTDSVDALYRRAIPMKCTIALTLPTYGDITADMVLDLLKRTVACAFEKGVVTSSGLAAIQRGILSKTDLTG